MPKKDLSHTQPHLRQTYATDKVAVRVAADRLKALVQSGALDALLTEEDQAWFDGLPDAEETLPVNEGDVRVVNLPRKR